VEIAPGVARAAVLRDTELGPGASQFAVIQAVSPSLRIEVNPVNVGDAGEIERAVAAFARAPNGGLIATGGGRMRSHRDLIVKLAARHKLPEVYYDRVYVDSGGLISYGPDFCQSVPRRRRLRSAWPLAARAQQGGQTRRIGVFMPGLTDDPEGQARNASIS
jgi:putative ABC transport system substrate-binding protein